MHTKPHRPQLGLTLVDCAITLGIVACLVGNGLPTLESARATYLLDAAASQVKTDVQYGRSAAVTMGDVVRFKVQSFDSGSCYVLHTGGPSDCSCSADGNATCVAEAQVLRTAAFSAGQPIRIANNSTSMAFDDTLGTVTPTGTISVTHLDGRKLHVVVNVLGRARTCAALGRVATHPAC